MKTIIASESRPGNSMAQGEQPQLSAIENTCVPVTENFAPQADPARLIFGEIANPFQPVLTSITDEAMARKLHGTGDATKPEIASGIFVQRRDLIEDQTVAGSVETEFVSQRIAVRDEFRQPLIGRNFEFS